VRLVSLDFFAADMPQMIVRLCNESGVLVAESMGGPDVQGSSTRLVASGLVPSETYLVQNAAPTATAGQKLEVGVRGKRW
jgi:hypothetical protein